MNMQEQAKIMRREGTIVLRQDLPSNEGFKSIIWINYEDSQYTVQMLNGVVQYIGSVAE